MVAKLDRASFSVSYPSRHRGVDYSSTIQRGKGTSSGGGFIQTEEELRREFEHFLLDLRLGGVFRG